MLLPEEPEEVAVLMEALSEEMVVVVSAAPRRLKQEVMEQAGAVVAKAVDREVPEDLQEAAAAQAF